MFGPRGVFGGGSQGSPWPQVRSVIEYITIATTGNTTNFGNLTQARTGTAACSDGSRGVFAGGFINATTRVNTIDYITIATTGNAVDFGDMSESRTTASCSNNIRGIFAGGEISSGNTNTIDYITIATTGNAADFGDLTQARRMVSGTSNSARGVFGGGYTSSPVNTIDYITIATTGNAADFGDLVANRADQAACSDGSRGVFAGGVNNWPTPINTIDYITIATTGNATNFGNLTQARRGFPGASDGSRGVFAGGVDTGGSDVNTIDYITIATTGNAVDFGDLSTIRGGVGACSGGSPVYTGNLSSVLTSGSDYYAVWQYTGNVLATLSPGSVYGISPIEYIGNLLVTASLSSNYEYARAYYDGEASATLTPNAIYSGQVEYIGNLSVIVSPTSHVLGSFVYASNLSFVLSPQSPYIPSWIYVGTSKISLSPLSLIEVSGYKPYALRAIIKIDGVDYSPDVYDAVTISKEEDAAATFSFSLNSNSAPSSFLDKEVKISFQAADASGTVVNVIDLVVGKVRDVEKDIDGGGLHLSGYDYGAIHNNPGELYSGDVTKVQTGNLYINASGTFNVGKNPIWDVVCDDVEGIEDGKDYFVDTLNGIIYIPFNSKFITTPGTLHYKYGEYFGSMYDLIQAIADKKGWTMDFRLVTLPAYSDEKFQPLIALSDESVIDAIKKCLEIGGCKIDTSLYPTLRVYSEVDNITSMDKSSFDESDIYEDTLTVRSTLDNLINKQTVRGVSVVNTNVILGDWKQVGSQSGSVAHKNYWWFGYNKNSGTERQQAHEAAVDKMNNTPAETAANVSVSLQSLFDYNYTLNGGGNAYEFSISQYFTINGVSIKGDADIEEDLEANRLEITVTRQLKILELRVDIYTWSWYGYLLYYPQVNFSLAVNAKELEYGDGTATPLVEVTGTRGIEGVSQELVGDVYEHPYLETSDQAKALCKAILLSRGLKTDASFTIPLHKAPGLTIGKRVTVSSRGITLNGLARSLAYTLDTNNGSGTVDIAIKGTGTSI
ncbi:MAG: hypothetical protein QY317_16140 [Candidatus Jettenia caeni]|nr:MAG: hypothetical protein QY317_16140 [Candidatus Jettenia caeni]